MGAGGAFAALAGALLAGALPLPDPLTAGPSALARSLLWLGCAGGLVGAAIAGLLGAASGSGKPAIAAARSLLAAAWGGWVGALGAIGFPLAAYRIWIALDLHGPIASLPPGPLAMGPAAWIAAIALWATGLGFLLPLAPGRPGGRPVIAGPCAAIAGLAGGTLAAFTGILVPMALLTGCAIALAGSRR